MERPGTKNILIGIGLFALGGIITALTYNAAAEGDTYIFAWGPMLVGGIQFFVGIFQLLAFSLKSDEGKTMHYAKIEMRAMLRALVYQAKSDNELDEQEIRMIQSLFLNYTGLHIDTQTLQTIADQVSAPDYNFEEDLGEMRNQISFESKASIIKMAYVVSLTDGSVGDFEAKRIYEIAATMGVHKNDVLPLVQEVQSLLDEEEPQPEPISQERKRKVRLIQ